MDAIHPSAPPLSASRRAQIHQILTEYGNKQVRSSTLNNASDDGAAPESTNGEVQSTASRSFEEAQDTRSDVLDTMDKLQHLIPDRM